MVVANFNATWSSVGFACERTPVRSSAGKKDFFFACYTLLHAPKWETVAALKTNWLHPKYSRYFASGVMQNGRCWTHFHH